ncbi:MAG: MBL fold metallo-hydrolase [Eubacterium sp.]|nr:MBL fold metallo-hydrolase [Eubacterium sp.]
MKIVTLVENTEGHAGCGTEHGLCLYVETDKHKLLMDIGASDLLLENAEKLGVDLTQVDTVVLSHGHYDHGGGILPFAGINPRAQIWIQDTAFGEFYSMPEGREPHYIGLAPEIRDLEQVHLLAADGGIYRIDEELTLFSAIGTGRPLPPANATLKEKKEQGMVQEDFRHEQCLVIRQEEKTVLFCGCAHHGVLNILDRYEELFGGAPDVVVSGFHMMKKNGAYTEEDIDFITDTALELKKYPTVFYTGHCTGTIPYEAMRKLMDRQVRYLHTGDELIIDSGREEYKKYRKENPAQERTTVRTGNIRRSSYMKAHRFFAWATVFCFIITMVTGYRRK